MNKYFKSVVLFLILISLIIAGASINRQSDVEIYIKENWINVTWTEKGDYPSEWNCVDISNAYMRENNEWCILEIHNGSGCGHAVNYQERDGVLFIRDEAWGCEYELNDWRSMTVYRYKCGVEAPQGIHYIYLENGFVVKSLR